jgi:hypothetical protein
MRAIDASLRELLKEAHPALTNEELDRFNELTARRYTLGCDSNGQEIRRLDRAIDDFVRTKMPRFSAIAQQYKASLRGERPRRS